MYVALTNACNRACPWCSTCSSPRGRTFLSVTDFAGCLPAEGPFQVQLEGGEPTVHPRLFEFVAIARANPRCERLVLCTNGVTLPRRPLELHRWLRRLGTPTTVKLSVNHYLAQRDDGLLALAALLRDELSGPGDQLVINVRVRPDVPGERQELRDALERAGLAVLANVFDLQAYGFAAGHAGWREPFLVGTQFSMINPDGRRYGPDLIARSEGMRGLP